MSQGTVPRWEAMRTDESRGVEQLLRAHFANADAYRYNSVSIRVRVVDPKFEGMSDEDRDAMVEPLLKTLPQATYDDIVNLITVAPSELNGRFRRWMANQEFEDPTVSDL